VNMMLKRYYPLALSTALLLAAGCGRSSQKAESATQHRNAVPVKVISLAEAQMPDVYTAPGTVRAKTSSTISSKLVAYVQSVNVREGDRVRAGQTLLVLNGQDVDARYRSAESAREEARRIIDEAESTASEAKANLELAEKTFGRLKDLYDKRSISNQEFDEASARLKSAQAAYDRARARQQQAQSRAQQMDAELRSAEITRDYATIAAPFSGVVISKSVDPGVLALPGMPLLTVEREGDYRLEASVEESRIASIQVRDRVPVRLDAPKQDLRGVVSEIAPFVDASSRTYTVKLDLPVVNGLHSGLFGRAQFSLGSRRALTVPCDAVIRHGDLASVLVAEDGFARRRLITTGTETESKAVVLSGLRPGDALIFPVPEGLQDGMPVQVRP
jgi:membrane fusion protein, multidrug efflux system